MHTKTELFTVGEAAEYLRISTSKVRKLIFTREITYLKFGKSIRFNIWDLNEYISLARRKREQNAHQLKGVNNEY